VISDQEALLITGEILAGFLKENLPTTNRWETYVVPALHTQHSIRERPLEQLDLSSLLQVFMGNRDFFRQANIFRTGLPFQLALCVRAMRNSRAHQSYASVLTDDERLFDLHALRRLTMLIDNRAITPGLTEQFHAALNERILDATRRCLSDDGDVALQPAVRSAEAPQIDELLQVSERTQQELASIRSQLRAVAERLAEVAQAAGQAQPTAAVVLPVEKHVDERLSTIEWKLDQLLGRGEAPVEAPDIVEQLGPPENLSYLEAKAALRTLRGRLADTYPDIEPVRQLLRQSMVDLILDRRVADLAAYEAQIPEVMRRDTDSRQLQELPQVFDIVGRLRSN
jgi:hypothetical protein